MDPVTIGLLLAGTALSGAGGIMGAGDAASRSRDTARARNAVLSDTLKRIDVNSAENRGLFNTRMASFSPAAQSTGLADAQTARVAGNTSNLTGVDTSGIPVSSGAPAAVKGEIAKRMLEAYGRSKAQATSSGMLGGYGDQWLGNRIGVTDTGNRINTVNNFSQGQARILPTLQDYAEQGNYRAPAILPQIMQFAGGVLAGAAGRGMFGGSGGGATPAINPGVAGGGYLGPGGVVYPGPGRY